MNIDYVMIINCYLKTKFHITKEYTEEEINRALIKTIRPYCNGDSIKDRADLNTFLKKYPYSSNVTRRQEIILERIKRSLEINQEAINEIPIEALDLPTGAINILIRGRIFSVQQLEKFNTTNQLIKIRKCGVKLIEQIQKSLERFQEDYYGEENNSVYQDILKKVGIL